MTTTTKPPLDYDAIRRRAERTVNVNILRRYVLALLDENAKLRKVAEASRNIIQEFHVDFAADGWRFPALAKALSALDGEDT